MRVRRELGVELNKRRGQVFGQWLLTRAPGGATHGIQYLVKPVQPASSKDR
jgi:hypothetical protein